MLFPQTLVAVINSKRINYLTYYTYSTIPIALYQYYSTYSIPVYLFHWTYSIPVYLFYCTYSIPVYVFHFTRIVLSYLTLCYTASIYSYKPFIFRAELVQWLIHLSSEPRGPGWIPSLGDNLTMQCYSFFSPTSTPILVFSAYQYQVHPQIMIIYAYQYQNKSEIFVFQTYQYPK